MQFKDKIRGWFSSDMWGPDMLTGPLFQALFCQRIFAADKKNWHFMLIRAEKWRNGQKVWNKIVKNTLIAADKKKTILKNRQNTLIGAASTCIEVEVEALQLLDTVKCCLQLLDAVNTLSNGLKRWQLRWTVTTTPLDSGDTNKKSRCFGAANWRNRKFEAFSSCFWRCKLTKYAEKAD